MCLCIKISLVNYPLFGKAVWGPFGHIVDITAVLATLFGLATSLGLGAQQISGGLNYLLRYMGPARLALWVLSEPIFATLYGLWLFEEVPSARVIIDRRGLLRKKSTSSRFPPV